MKFDLQESLIPFDDWCPNCGAGHVDMPGDDSTWKCRRCKMPLPRSVALTEQQVRARGGFDWAHPETKG